MENQNSIPLEEETSKDFVLVFEPLISKFKRIKVELKKVPVSKSNIFGSQKQRVNNYELVRINNYSNSRQFKKDLRLAIDGSLKKLETFLVDIPLDERTTIINNIIDDLEYFKNLIVKTGPRTPIMDSNHKYLVPIIFSKAEYEFSIDEFRDEEFHLAAFQIWEFVKVLYILIDDTKRLLKEIIANGLKSIVNAQNYEIKNHKLKTKLNVYELAYLFRILDAKGIFESKTKTELYKFIASNFETKKNTASLTEASVKNKFTTPDLKAAEFWKSKFLQFSTLCDSETKDIKNEKK